MTRESVLRVVGPPGTGKTSFIQRQVAAWAERYEPQDFVLTSFTRSAAAVLAGRVNVPRQNIATLHALAYRAIGSPPIAEKGALAKQWNESVPAAWRIEDGTADVDDNITVDQVGAASQFDDYCLARNRMLPDGHPLHERTRDFAVAWEDYKRQTGSIDFADMIDLARQNVYQCPGDPAVFVVDEAQDLTALQWDLINRWTASPSVEQVIVAGDPAQTLFDWAGATPEPLLSPLPEGRQRMLSQSYRLPPAVHQHAEAWLSRHSPPMMEGRTYAPKDGEPGRVRSLPSVTWQRPEALLRDLEAQLAAGRDCMVLASCGYMLRPLISLLRAEGLPFHNPYRRSDGSWNPLGAAREGVVTTLERVLAFLRPDPETWGDEARWWLAPEAAAWLDMLAASEFRARGAKTDLLRALGDGTADAVDSVLAALSEDGAMRALTHDTGWLSGHVLERFRRPAAYADAIRQRQGGAALRQEPRIIVGTVHSVKGGESDVVYVFPDQSRQGWEAAMMTQEGRDAMIRLAYVAFTRAKQELVLLGAQNPRLAMWS